MDAEAKRAKEQIKALPPKERIKHFWEYYRKTTFLIVIALVVVIAEVISLATHTKYDLQISAFTCQGLPAQSAEILTEEIKSQCYDINGNDSVDIQFIPYAADIEDPKYNPETDAIVQKLQVELVANNCPGYIVDKSYKKIIEEGFPALTKSSVEISKIPGFSEKLKLSEDIELYWLSVVEYESTKNNEKMIKKYELVEVIEEYFEKKLEEAPETK